MRIISWNIRHGGGSRAAKILDAVRSHAPDLAVLAEYDGATGESLREGLAAAGLTHQHTAAEDHGSARVLIASAVPLEPAAPSAPDLELPERWAEVVVPEVEVRVAGLYVPVTGRRPGRKRRMWQAVRAAAERRAVESYLIVGDWNTGDHPMDKTHPGRPFRFTDEYRQLLDTGYTEIWRHCHPDASEFSWYGRGRGYRIDHAFASPPLLERVSECRYSHQERESKVSDHSVMVIEIDSGAGAQ